jgi:hypothetical protein
MTVAPVDVTDAVQISHRTPVPFTVTRDVIEPSRLFESVIEEIEDPVLPSATQMATFSPLVSEMLGSARLATFVELLAATEVSKAIAMAYSYNMHHEDR